MKPKIFVSREFPGPGLEWLGEHCRIAMWPEEDPPPKAEIIKMVEGAEGILSMLTDPIDEEVMDAAGPNLCVVSNYAVGFDNIDVKAATARGIRVGNTPGVLTEATADLAFSLLMAAARRIVEAADFARQGHWKSWSPGLLLGSDVFGATLGIIGLGRIGQAVARRAKGFDMEVIGYHPGGKSVEGIRSVSLEEVVRSSDFLSLHVPSTPKTQHLVNESMLNQMKPTATLINTARGAVVDQKALFNALQSGQIACAALDVTDPEPLPADHELYSLPNCLIVPHLGSSTVSTRSKMGDIAAKNLLAGLKGEPLESIVNPEVLGNEEK